LSAKNRGVQKFVDTIGNIEVNNHIFEVFFVEVSHGPFHPNPELHVIDDNYKLAKLGKDSLDRNRGNVESDMILLFHLYADYLVVSLMDYYYYPIARKIPLDTIQIPLFANDPSFKMMNFINGLFKYRCILNNILENFKTCNIGKIRKRSEVEFMTQNTPQKKR
jgi:hypothetical protein